MSIYFVYGKDRAHSQIDAIVTESEWPLVRQQASGHDWFLLLKLPGDEALAQRMRRMLWGEEHAACWAPGGTAFERRGLRWMKQFLMVVALDAASAALAQGQTEALADEDYRALGLAPGRKPHGPETERVPVAKGLGGRLARLKRGDAALPRE
jgi:hypothetical protein